MESLKVGILEDRDDPFIRDLIARLGVEAEFLSFGEEMVAPSRSCRVVVDRASYCDAYLTEMMKGLSLDGSYVINNVPAGTAALRAGPQGKLPSGPVGPRPGRSSWGPRRASSS